MNKEEFETYVKNLVMDMDMDAIAEKVWEIIIKNEFRNVVRKGKDKDK